MSLRPLATGLLLAAFLTSTAAAEHTHQLFQFHRREGTQPAPEQVVSAVLQDLEDRLGPDLRVQAIRFGEPGEGGFQISAGLQITADAFLVPGGDFDEARALAVYVNLDGELRVRDRVFTWDPLTPETPALPPGYRPRTPGAEAFARIAASRSHFPPDKEIHEFGFFAATELTDAPSWRMRSTLTHWLYRWDHVGVLADAGGKPRYRKSKASPES